MDIYEVALSIFIPHGIHFHNDSSDVWWWWWWFGSWLMREETVKSLTFEWRKYIALSKIENCFLGFAHVEIELADKKLTVSTPCLQK